MKSSFDILSALYKVLNVPEVTEIISGLIYIGDVPDVDQKESISINTLSNPNTYLQNGYINLNVYVKELSSGRAHLAKFQQIINTIFPLVKDVQHEGYSFQIDDDKGVFKHQKKDNMYFYNIKLKFQTL